MCSSQKKGRRRKNTKAQPRKEEGKNSLQKLTNKKEQTGEGQKGREKQKESKEGRNTHASHVETTHLYEFTTPKSQRAHLKKRKKTKQQLLTNEVIITGRERESKTERKQERRREWVLLLFVFPLLCVVLQAKGVTTTKGKTG